jgi:hypothetical protein
MKVLGLCTRQSYETGGRLTVRRFISNSSGLSSFNQTQTAIDGLGLGSFLWFKQPSSVSRLAAVGESAVTASRTDLPSWSFTATMVRTQCVVFKVSAVIRKDAAPTSS